MLDDDTGLRVTLGEIRFRPQRELTLGSITSLSRLETYANLIIQPHVCYFVGEHMAGINGTLFVSAYGEELVEPDECKVMVTITSERGNAVEAQDASAKTFDALKKALFDVNIQSEIESIFFNVEKPKYWDSTIQRYIIQNFFRATHMLTVKVSAKKAGNTAQACTLNESTVSGVYFQLSEALEQSSRDKALAKAVKLAKEKAALLAKSAGVEIGTLQSLVDRAHSMTINADSDSKSKGDRPGGQMLNRESVGSSPERPGGLNFAVQKISVLESVQLAYTTC